MAAQLAKHNAEIASQSHLESSPPGEAKHQTAQHSLPSLYPNGNHGSQVAQEQNPELLQWRANVLLDEMMLGAVDIAANDSTPARAQISQPATTRHASDPEGETLGPRPTYTQSYSSNGYIDSSSQLDYPAEQHPTKHGMAEARYSEENMPPNGNVPSLSDVSALHHSQNHSAQNYSVDPHLRRSESQNASSSHAQSTQQQPVPSNGTEQWLFAAEQRYQQIAARQRATQQEMPSYDYDGWSMAADHSNQPQYGLESDMVQAEQKSVPTYPTAAQPVANQANGPAASDSIPSGTRQARKSIRSNLLPRMNALDSRAIQHEINVLQNSIETILPPGHESRIRAQHSLQKAYNILQEEPTRSAELEYYLQQVRTIVQRIQETIYWSNAYQSRLKTYLLAWLALSSIVIVSLYLYAAPLTDWLASVAASNRDSLWIYNLLTIAGAFFFGALGGGIGAFVNMIKYAQLDYGFFDRKYGLRGLLLPVIGAFIGVGLCVIFGIFYALFRLDPSANIWFGLLPALIALALAASQEYIYGTRA